MDNDQLNTLVQSYRHHENKFIKSCTADLTDSLLYGEMAFCLAGLKPIVLFDFPAELNMAYIGAVVRPWMEQHDKELMGHWSLIQRRLYSPEIQGNKVFFFIAVPSTSSTSLEQSLLLNTTTTTQGDDVSRCDIPSEDQLAILLDYPGRLPRSMLELDTMREVVYYNTHDKHILTTFACQLDQQELVHHHFKRYQDTMILIGLPLGIIFRRPT